MFIKTRNTVKKYRQGNIPAAFGTDLWLSGSTDVPNLLLKYYKYMNVTDPEMITLIQIFRLRVEDRHLHPGPEALAECLSANPEEIEKVIKSLLDKKIIVETLYYDESRDDVITGYDFEPLFEKLSECWACIRAKEIEKAGSKLEGQVHRGIKKDTMAACYKSFEKEFGRPLSPIEMEKIAQWVDQTGPDLVQEALKRAVLIGKWNFRYIDTILLEWKKNNLNSIGSIQEYDRQYQGKRNSRDTRKKEAERQEDGSSDSSRRRALIKKLYLT
ncbi:MAG: DnaD domain-containing protein [Bacillota bacterium]